jgi:A/G-specific adenine glycosylase
VQDVHLNYLVHAKNGAITLEHRSNEGIWKNLYQFPCVISDKALSEKRLSGNKEYQALVKAKNPPELMEAVLHKLSHRNLHIRFFKVEGTFNGKHQFEKVALNDLSEYPVPIVIARFLEKHF